MSGISIGAAAAQLSDRPGGQAPEGQIDLGNLLPVALSLAAVELGLGLWLQHQSRSKLKRALRLYHR